ncbi:hypothetical protein PHLGIDRAFT_38385 [Phlebiopsis gigantea 11061_1 CR5-6]|uniref:F-box domain-containing protein n=1 Tax=Phlebiopsis gigantea (strain 11061_1 CR5-6) TaxID=745531 RepID=A0A0C3P908_PHLG1|nr:hypothetical protein PHLGIDRAFT_38385 [Phlebiopsis gigantea 11061_1 CR5-6]
MIDVVEAVSTKDSSWRRDDTKALDGQGRPLEGWRLRLTDLPPELLDAIASKTTPEDSVSLGLTCKLMHDICWAYMHRRHSVGLPHIYNLKRQVAIRQMLREERKAYVKDILTALWDELQEFIPLICTPKIANSITDLKLTCWKPYHLRLGLDRVFNGPNEVVVFQTLVTSTLTPVLGHCRNVTKLLLDGIRITDEFRDAVCQLPQVSHIRFLSCEFALSTSSTSSAICPAQHVSISAGVTAPLTIAPMLPKMRWCSLFHSQESFSVLVPSVTKPLDTLERIILHDMSRDELRTLTHLLSSYVLPAPLTHLKITTAPDIPKNTLLRFIESLAHTSVEYLSIDSIGYAGVDLLHHVALHIPRLRALTLVYRDDPLAGPAACYWPCSAWEYAEALARLGLLEYFGWNHRVDTVYFPDALPYFEAGSHNGAHGLSEADSEVDTLFALFAAYCPRLKILAMLKMLGESEAFDRLFRLRPTMESLKEEDAVEVRSVYDPSGGYSWPLLDPGLELLRWW